jgi:hypothetical protein
MLPSADLEGNICGFSLSWCWHMLILFYRSGSFRVGVGDAGTATAFSYSQTRGLLAGISLEGSIIFGRQSVNYNFYGQRHSSTDILSGSVKPPKAASPLYDALRDVVTVGATASYGPMRSVDSTSAEVTGLRLTATGSDDDFDLLRNCDLSEGSIYSKQEPAPRYSLMPLPDSFRSYQNTDGICASARRHVPPAPKFVISDDPLFSENDVPHRDYSIV